MGQMGAGTGANEGDATAFVGRKARTGTLELRFKGELADGDH